MINNNQAWEKLLGKNDLPSVDTLARGLRKSDIEGSRKVIKKVNHKLRRNKAYNINEASNGLMVFAVDGHETFSSELCCCPECKTREKEVKGKTVIEYYHYYVICQLILCS